MEFADLDDDLFSEERQRNYVDEEYSARFCHPGWFLDVSSDLLVSDDDKLSVQKHSADYLYFKKDYEAAIVKYVDVLSILPSGNTTLKRECYEGLSRSYMKTETSEKAYEYAEKLHATSKTVDQTTVSCSVLIDACIVAEKYHEGVKAAQLLVSLHPCSSDAWLKLAWSYACLYSIELHNTKELFTAAYSVKQWRSSPVKCNGSVLMSVEDSKCKAPKAQLSLKVIREELILMDSESFEEGARNIMDLCREALENPITFTEEERCHQFVCGCLFRSLAKLKRTEGTTFGFALDSSLDWQKRIQSEMENLLDEKSLSFVRSEISLVDDAYFSSSPLKEHTPEFVDRGSSKFRNDEAEESVEDVSLMSFERQWFKWIK